MNHLISVKPEGEGWAIHSADPDEDLTFPTGGRAESAARLLAHRKALEGMTTEVRVYVRGGALAGVLNFPAQRSA
jgi:hypothetical protein